MAKVHLLVATNPLPRGSSSCAITKGIVKLASLAGRHLMNDHTYSPLIPKAIQEMVLLKRKKEGYHEDRFNCCST